MTDEHDGTEESVADVNTESLAYKLDREDELEKLRKASRRGRRRRGEKNMDANTVYRMAKIGCTIDEIAAAHGVSQPTAIRHEWFYDVYYAGKMAGNAKLRKLQWKSAETGDTKMLVWLGKQYLGQSDKVESLLDVQVNNMSDEEIIERLKLMYQKYTKKVEKMQSVARIEVLKQLALSPGEEEELEEEEAEEVEKAKEEQEKLDAIRFTTSRY